MIKRSLKMTSMLLLVAQCTLGFAAHAGNSVDKLLELSGSNKAVESFPDGVKSGLMQAKAGMSAGEFDKLVASVDDSITPVTIKKMLKAQVSKALNEKEINELLKWYGSDLGKEMVATEAKSNTPDGFAQMQQQAQKLFADTPRVEMAKRYDVLVGATDALIDMQVSSGAAIYSAMAAMANPDVAPQLNQYKSMIASQMAPMREQMESMIIMSFVYAHQNTDIEKLKTYEAFLNTPVSVKFSKEAMKGMLNGLDKTVVVWAGELAKLANDTIKANAK